jgi:FKBP-type peptidyl-prolyl cis-trans isomerase 2
MEKTMPEQPQTIENLMKVTLTIQATNPSVADDRSTPYVFIYGVGPSGITPFEKALHGKAVGDRIRFEVTPSTLCETFGHLELPFNKPSGIMAPVSIEVAVVDVIRAQDREVVKAMAAGGSCSDCGCGCGGH